MNYIPCEGKDCPICKQLGPPDTLYITIRDKKSNELMSLKVKKVWAEEHGLISKERNKK